MASYSYEVGTEFTATGTAASTAASTAVVGTATSFDTELETGDLIIIAGETRVVDTVSDAAHLDVTASFTTGSGGAVAFTGVDLTNVEDLLTTEGAGDRVAPRSFFTEYSKLVPLGNGLVRGLGWSKMIWRWGFVSQALRDQLRTYCTTASNAVYIRSRENDSSRAYQYYSCSMIWPAGKEQSTSDRVLDFVIEFIDVTEVSVS